MKTIFFIFSAILAFFAVSAAPTQAYYLDTPHNQANGILCSTCHGATGTKIHVKLHSDLVINGTQNWTTQCLDCHNPHFQRQYRAYANSDSNVYLVTGKLVAGSPIVDNGDSTTTIEYITSPLPQAPWDNAAQFTSILR